MPLASRPTCWARASGGRDTIADEMPAAVETMLTVTVLQVLLLLFTLRARRWTEMGARGMRQRAADKANAHVRDIVAWCVRL